jgi:hypothetical protein
VWLQASGPQPAGDGWAEGEDPAPDTRVGDHDPPLGQEFRDVSEAEREAKIHPDRTLDDVAWKAVAGERKRRHGVPLRRRAGRSKVAECDKPLLIASISHLENVSAREPANLTWPSWVCTAVTWTGPPRGSPRRLARAVDCRVPCHVGKLAEPGRAS